MKWVAVPVDLIVWNVFIRLPRPLRKWILRALEGHQEAQS